MVLGLRQCLTLPNLHYRWKLEGSRLAVGQAAGNAGTNHLRSSLDLHRPLMIQGKMLDKGPDRELTAAALPDFCAAPSQATALLERASS